MMKKRRSKRRGLPLIVIGLLLIAASAALAFYNLWDDNRAASAAEDVLIRFEEIREKNVRASEPPVIDLSEDPTELLPDYVLDPNMEMPTIVIDGYPYIGTLTIPPLEIELPVMDDWDYTRMKIAPCRYSGSVYLDDLVICAHNYNTHFGRLDKLQQGDLVVFTDAVNNTFEFEVAETQVLMPTAIDEMTTGGWDLTLFTCNYSGRARVAVRCVRVSE